MSAMTSGLGGWSVYAMAHRAMRCGVAGILGLCGLAGPAAGSGASSTAKLAFDSSLTPRGSQPNGMVTIPVAGGPGERVVFSADTPEHGRELWSSDGTVSGTSLLVDIRPGSIGGILTLSFPERLFVRVGGWLVFAAAGPTGGEELWVCDGTAPGTRMLRDINSGVESSRPRRPFVQNNVAYFFADVAGAITIWRTDGTEAGTSQVGAYPSGLPIFRQVRILAVDGQSLYATEELSPSTAVRLDKFDLVTGVRTQLAASIFPAPTSAAVVNGRMVFAGADGTGDVEPWASDGTAAGTGPLTHLWPGPQGSSPAAFFTHTGSVYFAARNSVSGQTALYRTDGTEAGTALVRDLGTADESPVTVTDMTSYAGRLVFAFAEAAGTRVWASDGTEAGTGRVLDVAPRTPLGVGGVYTIDGLPRKLTVNGPWLDIIGAGPVGGVPGIQLWRTDVGLSPAVAITGVPDDASVISDGVLAYALLNGEGGTSRVVFAAATVASGAEPGVSQGTPESTALVGDLYNGTFGLNPSAAYRRLGVGGRLAFFADVNAPLRFSEGSPGTTVMPGLPVGIVDAPGSTSNPAGMAAAENRLFFAYSTPTQGSEPWVSDGTAAGTRLIADLTTGPSSSTPRDWVSAGGIAYFRRGLEWWRTDGSAGGTFALTVTGAGPYQVYEPTDVNGTLFFFASSTINGVRALWKSDGTAAGTTIVAAVGATSTQTGPPAGTSGGVFYFQATSDAAGYELWKSDGTAAGTVLVADVVPGRGGSFPAYITAAATPTAPQAVYFVANGTGGSRELWYSDGTGPGTRRVKTLPAGAVIAPGSVMHASGSRLLFLIGSSVSAAALWSSDGTEAGTAVVSAPQAGPITDASDLVVCRGRAYFATSRGGLGRELWSSDGTEAGTRIAADVGCCGRSGLGTPGQVWTTAVNSRVYFLGDDGRTGAEWWVLDACPADFNNDGDVSVGDVFAYLAAYFAASERADVNGVGGVSVQDVFDYLTGWFVGCE